jgi:hypothetical protein
MQIAVHQSYTAHWFHGLSKAASPLTLLLGFPVAHFFQNLQF